MLVSGLIRKFERSAKSVSEDFFDQLEQTANQLDHIAQKRITDARIEAEELEVKLKTDIEELLNNADNRVSQQLKEIDSIRQDTIKDTGKIIAQTDYYLENRINQMALLLMETVSNTETKLNFLEQQVFQDASYLVDRLEEIIDKTLEQIRNELKKYLGLALPTPFDPCRKRLNIGLKPGALLSDIEIYRLSECYQLMKLNENTPINEVRDIYGQLQLNAARLSALTRNAPELRRIAIEDWLKYGMLGEFWRKTMQLYETTEPLLLASEVEGELLMESDDSNV